jgi:hypothetical protein
MKGLTVTFIIYCEILQQLFLYYKGGGTLCCSFVTVVTAIKRPTLYLFTVYNDHRLYLLHSTDYHEEI